MIVEQEKYFKFKMVGKTVEEFEQIKEFVLKFPHLIPLINKKGDWDIDQKILALLLTAGINELHRIMDEHNNE